MSSIRKIESLEQGQIIILLNSIVDWKQMHNLKAENYDRSCDTQSQRLDVILIVIQTIKLEDKINIPFT